ncbi:hypothetical protein J1614_000600 [Plenodomus biglobosus]|nr:hypothetical protein J1614_000600 [Plenodomus biglobosus]
MWGSWSWEIAWVKRHQRSATLPGLEAPEVLILDLREYFGGLAKSGRLGNAGGRRETAQKGKGGV